MVNDRNIVVDYNDQQIGKRNQGCGAQLDDIRDNDT